MNNNRGSADITLTVFGGLCTEVAPSDLPEGASPLNYDCDFDIGAVYTRPGLDNVYSYQDLATGELFAGNSGQIPVNNVQWTLANGYLTTTWLNGQSPIAWWNNFGLDLSPTGVTGIQFQITGHYTGSASPEVVAQLTLTQDGRGVGIAKTFHFQTNDTTVSLGGPSDIWSSPVAVDEINLPGFGLELYGISPGQTASLFIQSVSVNIFLAKQQAHVNFIKTFIEDDQDVHTFVLDSAGVLWEEDVTHNPDVLVARTEVIPPNTFAQSTTNDDEEWIAFSNLKNGTAIPRHGTNLDRISQVGPGAAPIVVGMTGVGNQATSWSIASITQTPQKCGFYDILWSAGPGQTGPGNMLTLYYAPQGANANLAIADSLALGGAVYISGLPGIFGALDGTYVIVDQNYGVPPGGGANYWYFTVQVQQTGPTQGNNLGGGSAPSLAGCFQPTLATLTTPPGQPTTIVVGQQISIQGTGSGYDGTWTVLNAENGGQYTITETSLAGGIATYTFTPIGNSAIPTVGAVVTVTGALNGPILPATGASVFDVANTAIITVSGRTFQVAIPGAADVGAAAEPSAGAIVSGNIYQFDPGLNYLTSANPAPGGPTGIFGNVGAGGTVTISGNIGAGVRQAVCIFQTRNGYQTAPSPPVVFETTGDANGLAVSNICIGPPNVEARIIGFTPAGSSNFFYIPTPVTVTGVGQEITYSATVINDNQTTNWNFVFTDAVLMAATAIDIQGNDLFNQIEVGSSCAVVSYAARNFYIMQQNKVQNFTNLTFDGGFISNKAQFNLPAGWTNADPHVNSTTYAHLNVSPIFGFSYYIQNQTSSVETTLGAITQNAYQDAYKVPILELNTTYSVRIWLRAPSGITDQGGGLIIDITSYLANQVYGSAYFLLSGLTTEFQEFTLPLNANPIPPFQQPPNTSTGVPTDLILRLYAADLPPGADVEVDRFEIFPTLKPDLVTDVYGSYINNPEAVDGISGDLNAGGQNNQPVLGAFVQYDLLYLLKTRSMFQTQDSPSEEPAAWKIREVSNKVGTCGIHAYDCSSAASGGEEWMITANRLGVYIFSGGEPIKISQEIQNLWEAINWDYGHTIIVRNDAGQRRITIQVPLATPNPWLPDAPLNANPTTPNVMFAMSYKELQSASALAERGPVKLSYSGRLITWDMSRKWSIWQIPSPYSDFIRRPDGSDQYLIGSGRLNSKVWMLDPNSLNDDGLPINGLYTSYGFVKSEQAQQFGNLVGNYRKLYKYSSYNLEGAGSLRLRALVNNLTPSYPYVVPGGVQLTCPAAHNREVPFNLEAQRLFLEFSTNAVDANFRLSEIILSVVKSPHAPVRGIN